MQNPDEIKYTMPTLLRFDKDIEAEKLKESIIKTIEAHPYLKTRIITTEDGTLKQERNDNTPIDEIEIVEVDSISDDEIIKNDVKSKTMLKHSTLVMNSYSDLKYIKQRMKHYYSLISTT